MFLIFIRVGSVAARFKSAFLIAEKFQKTHDFRELQSAVTFVLVKVSSKFKLFCAAFIELYQINFDLETFIEIKKSAGVANQLETLYFKSIDNFTDSDSEKIIFLNL